VTVRVFLGGEGPNELGGRAGDPVYADVNRPGVVEALLRRAQPDGWEVAGARAWKSIRKLRIGPQRHADTHNVLGLVLDAKEADCGVLAFTRDRDNDTGRVKAVQEGIELARSHFPGVGVIGGVPIPKLEAWILALMGEHKTEELRTAAAVDRLELRGVGAKDTATMVGVVEAADLGKLPKDAEGLCAFVERSRDVLKLADAAPLP